MKVLLLIDSLTSGGMERRLVELIKGFQDYSDVTLQLVVFSDKIHYQEVFELGVQVTIIRRRPKKNPVVFYRLYRLCKQWQPDIIHSWGSMSALLAVPSSLLLGIRFINGYIVDAPKDLKWYDRRMLRAKLSFPFSKKIVGNSIAGLKAYNVPKEKGICIYNGFDPKRLSHLREIEVIRAKFQVETTHTIGMVGSFSDRKDFESFISAGLLMLQTRRDVTFFAVGDGLNLEKCKVMVPAGEASFFKFTGLQTDVESIIRTFDIGVLLTNSKVHGEGISNAILEYMVLEKPTVATSGGGTDEAVADGKTGILIPANAPQTLADTLIYLLDKPYIREEMGEAAKKRADKLFGLDKMTKAYYRLYQEILSH